MDINETLEPGYLSRRKQVDERVWEQILNSERGQSTPETPPQKTEPSNRSEVGQTITNEKVHLDLLATGWSKEQIDKEMGGVQVSAYDPIDLAVDIATGGITGAGREGEKLLLKGAIKEGSKAIGKSAATDAAYGALSGGFMGLADYAGAGPAIQALTGIIGPVATGGLLTLSRTGLAAFLKSLKEYNPTVYKQVTEAVEQTPGNPLSQAVKSAGTDISVNTQDTYQKVKDLADNWDTIVTYQRRGTRPREMALAESAGIRMTPDDIKAIAPGTAMNDAQAALTKPKKKWV